MPEGIEITRVFAAPRERLWREWTQPESFADWFGGTGGEVPVESVSMDVQVGGSWSLTMFAGGRQIHWRGEYQEVDEPARLAFTITDRPEEVYEVVTVDLTDLGDGRTEMHFTQGGEMTPEQYGRARDGWGTFFDRIDERVAA